MKATIEDAEKARERGRHGEENKERKGVKPSGVVETEGRPKASGVAENPRGGFQGVGGKVKSPQGIVTPEVEELSLGVKPPE